MNVAALDAPHLRASRPTSGLVLTPQAALSHPHQGITPRLLYCTHWTSLQFTTPHNLVSTNTHAHAPMAPSNPTKTMLQTLSHRPDVQRTLILSRSTGAVIESSGYETSSQTSTSSTSHDQAEDTLSANDATSAPAARRRDEQSRVSRDAALVFAHVNATAEFVKELGGRGRGDGGGLRKSHDDHYDDYDDKDTETGNGDDEMKLCRLRTKRFEYMIVPGTFGSFLL